MELENMNYEAEVMEDEIIETETANSGLSTGAAMLIGAGLTLATTAIVKLVKKGIAKHKAKKELKLVEADENIEPTDEQIVEVATK